ncbi:MAG: hypothetical protein IJX92_07345 [Clostridia bacterium]|nr:hypothetical protein [Clostridia bacterium]
MKKELDKKKSDAEMFFDILKERQEKTREYFVPLDDADERLNKVLGFCTGFFKYESGDIKVRHAPEAESVLVTVSLPIIDITKEVLDGVSDVMEYLNGLSVLPDEEMLRMEFYVRYYRREISRGE